MVQRNKIKGVCGKNGGFLIYLQQEYRFISRDRQGKWRKKKVFFPRPFLLGMATERKKNSVAPGTVIQDRPADEEEDNRQVRPQDERVLNLPVKAFEKKEKSARKLPKRKPKRPVSEIEPPGFGPWWTFMMVNVTADENTKKQTEVRMDTYPEFVQAIKNVKDNGNWVTVMKIGPFYDLVKAATVLAEWSDGTRGPGPRIAQGICIWNKHKESTGANLYLINQSKKDVQESYHRYYHHQRHQNRSRNGFGNDIFVTAAGNGDDNDGDNNNNSGEDGELIIDKEKFAFRYYSALDTGGSSRPGSVIVRDILTMDSIFGVGFNSNVTTTDGGGDNKEGAAAAAAGSRKKIKKEV